MSKSSSTKKNNQSPKQKFDPVVIAALIGLTGTIITALFASPVLIALIQRTSASMPTGTSPMLTTPIVSPTNLPSLTQTTSSHCPPDMAIVPSGVFRMGATPNDQEAQNDEKPQREVYLDAFCIEKIEVSNQKYFEYLRKSLPPNTIANLPAVNLSWEDANAYCEGKGYSLPTEAQWEKAARGENEFIYPWGNRWDPTRANYGGTQPRTARPVTDYLDAASPYGILNMAGNVAEWVADWYTDDWYNRMPQTNPFKSIKPTSEATRVVRGGSFVDSSKLLRTSRRDGTSFPDDKFNFLGFRCATKPLSP